MPHVYGVWRFRLTAVFVAIICAICIWIGVIMLPSQYGASAKVFVDTDSLLRPLLRGLTVNDNSVLSDVQMMTSALTLRPQLEKLARQTDLDITAENAAELEGVLNHLRENISVAVDRQNIYTIGFTSRSRSEALEVTTQLLNNFVEDTVGSGQDDSEQAEVTLRREIDDYERRLVESENRLKEFKQKNVGMMPNETGDYYNRLQLAIENLRLAEMQQRMTQRRVNALRSQIEGEEPVFGMMGNSTAGPQRVSSYDIQIQTLEAQVADLLVEYTEKHPEVVRTLGLIEQFQQKREAELANQPIPVNPVTGNLDLNPIYQSLRIQLNDAEVESSAIAASVADRKREVNDLKQLVDVIPQVEAELGRLNRDYDVISARYQQMLSRWEDLQTSKRVTAGSNTANFRVIDPPFAPTAPVGPPRALLTIAGFVLSIGLGLGVAFLIQFFKPTIYTKDQLSQLVDFNMIGEITSLATVGSNPGLIVKDICVYVCVVFLLIGTVVVSMFAEPGAVLITNLLG